jgi:hypothetical protein
LANGTGIVLANEWDAEKLDEWGLDLPVDLSVTELEAEEDELRNT